MIAKTYAKNASHEDGFVALIVTVTVAIILSSITISFMKLMTREERQALDRQLSSQAFYAAESGVNFAVRNNTPDRPDDCGPVTSLDPPADIIKYTCVLIDSTPPDLVFDSVATDNPTVFNLTSPVDTLIINWQNTNGSGGGRPDSDYPKFFPVAEWGNIGVLEVVIYPIVTPLSRSYVEANARTFYLYPTAGSGGTSVSYASEDGKVVEGNCSSGTTPNRCGPVTISGVPTAGVSAYVIRLRSVYSPTSVTINGQLSGSSVALAGAQKVIDATGKSNDVLRRIQVRLPLRSSLILPIFAIETADDICKQLEVQPTGPGGATVDHCAAAN